MPRMLNKRVPRGRAHLCWINRLSSVRIDQFWTIGQHRSGARIYKEYRNGEIRHKSGRSICLTLGILRLAALVFGVLSSPPVSAQVVYSGGSTEDVVAYDASFFERYKPNTALDMVQRIPGFQIDDGADKRGFGGAVGNVLINDRYPSAKQDSLSSILDRIPAGQVKRVELIRGQVRSIDLLGQAVVASVILREDIPATTRWDVSVRKNFDHSPLTVRGAVSISDQIGNIEYNAGVDYRKFASGEFGTEDILNGNDVLIEDRFEDSFLSGNEGNGNLNAAMWIGETRAKFNAKYGFEDRENEAISIRIPQGPGGVAREDFFFDEGEQRLFEAGADAERILSQDLLAKGILLYTRETNDTIDTERRVDASGVQTLFRVADADVLETESIARLEFDWSGWTNHAVQINLEGARNVIESVLVQTVDTGSGPVEVPVPGANTRVEENRGDFLFSDTWFMDEFELNYGIGAETSTISQTGDVVQKRSFSFIKPQIALTYSPTQQRQTRVSVAREVSQLDFSDFVSATVFQDDDLALGNPNLKPESTWVAELSEERRFGELSVVKVTVFHHWISDVEDLLPLTPTFEAPGNIGDGRRWGIEFEATVPLDSFGLTGARFDVELRLQDSTVTDPVTGSDRVLSGQSQPTKPLPFRDENHYAFGVDFRQDLEAARFAWGWDVRNRAERELFKVNELDVRDEGTEFNVFFETTRWLGLKMRLSGNNLLDFEQLRHRTIYTGERELTPVERRELQDRTDGRRIVLSLSGSF